MFTSALLHGDAVFLHEQGRKFLEGGGLVQHGVDLLSQLVQLGLVDGLGDVYKRQDLLPSRLSGKVW